MDALVKWLSADYPLYQIMFFRSAAALLPVSIFVAMAGGISILRTTRPRLHLFRCTIGISAMGCAFYGLANMPLAEAMAIFHSAPILMTALSVPLLREKVGIRRWLAVFVGFVGMLLVIQPGAGLLEGGRVIMLIAAFLVALASNVIRILIRTDDPASITFYFTFSAVVVTGLISLYWGWVRPTTIDLILLIAIGMLGGCGQYFMTLSFKNAELGLVAPLKFLTIVIAGIIGYLVWSEVPDKFSIVGIVVIITSGVYTMHREARLSRIISVPVSAEPELLIGRNSKSPDLESKRRT